MRGFALFILLLASAAPGLAQQADTQPPAGEEKPKDPMICKRTQQTGTRIGSQRICLTQSQWDAQRRELDAMQREQNQIRPNAPE